MNDLSKNDLIKKCKELNITKYSSKNKAGLIKLIENKLHLLYLYHFLNIFLFFYFYKLVHN